MFKSGDKITFKSEADKQAFILIDKLTQDVLSNCFRGDCSVITEISERGYVMESVDKFGPDTIFSKEIKYFKPYEEKPVRKMKAKSKPTVIAERNKWRDEVVQLKVELKQMTDELNSLRKFKGVAVNQPELLQPIEEVTFAPLKAARDNKGKPQLSFMLDIPVAMAGVCKQFELGVEKYDRDNFKKGLDKNELIDSAMRHLMDYKAGVEVDVDSNQCHTFAAAWNLLILAEQHSFGGDE